MLLPKKLNRTNYHTMFDWLIPKNILNQDYERDYLARRNLLQARAVVTVIVSALVVLIVQLVIDIYLSFNKVTLPHVAWPFSFIGTLICAAILCCVPSEKITISQAAKVGVYFFLSTSVYVSCIMNGIQTLSHANLFVVPPFGYIFVSKKFGKQTTILVCIIHIAAFFRSLGKQINPISLSSSAWVVCDVYILCFVYFLFAAYDQEFQSNQERTQKSLDEAKSAATAKSMFISNVSHELRTPLHGILATVEILAKTRLDESQRMLLNAIESCGTNLISVVNQVLTYSRVEHNKLELEREVFDIYTVMQEIGDGLAPIPERKNLDFFVCLDTNPLKRFLVGDVGVLRQIILNLLGNAIKFTDKGRIELRAIEITDDDENNSSAPEKNNSPKAILKIDVNDTGRGISPDFISHMFQPFSQEDSSLKRKFEGTGLGLSIVKGLLDLMNSQLEVYSKLGQGSKFSFKLELPISDRLDDMYPSPLPFDHKHLKLPPSEQEILIKKLRSLSYLVLDSGNLLLLKKITHYLDQWNFNYRITDSITKLRFECMKQHADIVILNDNISDLEYYLNESIQYHQNPKKVLESGSAKKESIKENEIMEEQRVVFFNTIETYQGVEALLMKYKPQSATLITKPAGPVKILTAIIKAMESLLGASKNPKNPKNPKKPLVNDKMKAQEEKKKSIREEYIDFIRCSGYNKFGSMDIGPDGELTISPSRVTPPAMFDRIFDKKTIMEQKEQLNGGPNTRRTTLKDPKHISFLIVEDNKINVMILTTMLKQSGYYNYDIANNGLEAVEKFIKRSYDIVFMDLQMPICDGIVATKEIRKFERGEETRLLQSTSNPESSTERVHRIGRKRKKKAIIVAMTGLASNEDSQIAEAAGCNEFLTKPVSIKSLNSRMESWTKEVLKAEEEAVMSSSSSEETDYDIEESEAELSEKESPM